MESNLAGFFRWSFVLHPREILLRSLDSSIVLSAHSDASRVPVPGRLSRALWPLRGTPDGPGLGEPGRMAAQASPPGRAAPRGVRGGLGADCRGPVPSCQHAPPQWGVCGNAPQDPGEYRRLRFPLVTGAHGCRGLGATSLRGFYSHPQGGVPTPRVLCRSRHRGAQPRGSVDCLGTER